MESLLKGGTAYTTISHNCSVPYFESWALHYLCHPSELEHVNAHDFFSQFEVVNVGRNNADELLRFQNSVFQHPSFQPDDNRFLQGVRFRDENVLIKVFQYSFPDTADFDGSIMDPRNEINEATETFSKLALLLFLPHREHTDLLVDSSYTIRFCKAIEDGIIGESPLQFLQNVQDARVNCTRVLNTADSLERTTHAFKPGDTVDEFDNFDDDKDQEEEEDLNGEMIDSFLELLQQEADEIDRANDLLNGNRTSNTIPATHSVSGLRQRGSHKGGYESLAKMSINPNSNQHVFEMQEPTSQNGPADAEENNPDSPGNDDLQPQREPTRADITNVLLTRTSQQRRTFKEITDSAEEVDVLEANGSVESIVDWARKAKLDELQRRAFEIITGTFVLTFFQSKQDPESVGCGFRSSDREYLQQKLKLKRLVEDDRLKTGEQLICFLHGPGGSGKSTVIDLVTEYARDYCSYMEDYQFTSRTIVVTAMSGIAATLLMGETTHSAVYLNQKTDIKAEQVDAWRDTCLLIVDEISFATKKQIIKLHKNLTRLKQKIYSCFGGLNVMFAGDLRQMEPPGQYDKPLYEDDCLEFEEWINRFIEPEGMHRFKDDPEWGTLLRRFQDGTATLADRVWYKTGRT
jgi:hypothetical protein